MSRAIQRIADTIHQVRSSSPKVTVYFRDIGAQKGDQEKLSGSRRENSFALHSAKQVAPAKPLSAVSSGILEYCILQNSEQFRGSNDGQSRARQPVRRVTNGAFSSPSFTEFPIKLGGSNCGPTHGSLTSLVSHRLDFWLT
uniref:Uncharacterized protein n=1 Tax=Solanum tuberosum TaxID=4113 RepID=M1DX00_SOLTU